MRRLMREIFESGAHLSRETVSALIPLTPAIWPALVERTLELDEQSRDIVYDQAARLLRRRDRLSSRETELLSTVWNCEWAKAHIAVLFGAIHRDIIEVMSTSPDRLAQVSTLKYLFFLTSRFGFQPHVVRGLWFVARFGKYFVRTFKDELALDERDLRVQEAGVPMALAAIGLRRERVRAEISKVLYTSEESSFSAVIRRALVEVLETPTDRRQENERAFREAHAKTIARLSMPPIDWASATPETRDWLRGCSPSLYVDVRVNLWTKTKALAALLQQLSWIVGLEPEHLYLPKGEFAEPWQPRHTLSFLEGLSPELVAVRAPIRAAATPGRNDPCTCGSAKKYKRCCGA